MSAIYGMVDLVGNHTANPNQLIAMGRVLPHRGSDEGIHEEPGLGFGWRNRASLNHAAFGSTVDNSILAVCYGALLDAQELLQMLPSQLQQIRTTDSGKLIACLWEQFGEKIFDHLRGPFAFAVWDRREQRMILARDRVGVAPLYWARTGEKLIFASEIRAILASGLIKRQADLKGLDHVVTFLATPAARTCFDKVQAILPGCFLKVQLRQDGSCQVTEHRYWDLDFPNRGDELDADTPDVLADQLQTHLLRAIERRLTLPGRVASFISGGIDCSTMAALAGRFLGKPIPTYTVRIEDPNYDESERATIAARACGAEPTIFSCNRQHVVDAYQNLIRATEAPVSECSCTTLLLLANRIRSESFDAVLTGDGADDLFAGYPWFRFDRRLRSMDWLPFIRPSLLIRRLYLRITAPHIPWSMVKHIHQFSGGHHAWNDVIGLFGMSRSRFYSNQTKEALSGHVAWADIPLNLERMKQWHPLNQDLYIGMKIQVPGLLLQPKGERMAMFSGLEPRQPFLDEDVIRFSAKLHPHWKLRRMRDKFLLRQVAARYLPPAISQRPKSDFIAPFDSMYREPVPTFVQQLLSEESLRKTDYFDVQSVRKWLKEYSSLRSGRATRTSIEIGLSAVVATQLWHHTFIEGNLADLPSDV